MITREEIRELAQFQCSEGGSALSFYFQPRTPQNRSHREETIQAKEMVRQAMNDAEKSGRNGSTRGDLARILDVAGNLHGNQARAKAIFACGAENYWREFDLPAWLPGTQLVARRHFHLKPLAALLGVQPRLCVALVDRHRARFFDMRLDDLKERGGMFGALPRRGRSDGFAGYEAGHVERSANNEAMHHFKNVAERLKEELEKGTWERLIVGCHDKTWPEFESHLHPYVAQRLLSHFNIDPAGAGKEEIREQASRIFREATERRRQVLLTDVMDQARSNGKGALGLRRVLRALEMGEVQTLLMAENFAATAAECTGCGHLDSHVVDLCAVCGRATRDLEDVADALVNSAIRRDIELFYVPPSEDFAKAGNIAALLRFRADQSTTSKLVS